MRLTLAQIAELVEGELQGDPDLVITGVGSLDAAGPGDVTFVTADKVERLASCSASAALTPERVEGWANQVVTANPHLAFTRVLEQVEAERRALPSGIHPSAAIDETAELGEGVAVGACAVIGPGCRIGDRTVIGPNTSLAGKCEIGSDGLIYANVAIREGVRIGDRVIVHCNSTLGGDGFGFLQVDGRQVKVPQVGGVVLGDDVEIGCNCTVDRGTMDDTVVEEGVKMDNHCHVAHNCRVGAHTVMAGYSRLGGSTTLGRNCILAADVSVSDHVTLGDRCVVTATASVAKSYPEDTTLGGTPAVPFEKAKRVVMAQMRLPRLIRQVTEMRDEIDELRQRLDGS